MECRVPDGSRTIQVQDTVGNRTGVLKVTPGREEHTFNKCWSKKRIRERREHPALPTLVIHLNGDEIVSVETPHGGICDQPGDKWMTHCSGFASAPSGRGNYPLKSSSTAPSPCSKLLHTKSPAKSRVRSGPVACNVLLAPCSATSAVDAPNGTGQECGSTRLGVPVAKTSNRLTD